MYTLLNLCVTAKRRKCVVNFYSKMRNLVNTLNLISNSVTSTKPAEVKIGLFDLVDAL